MGDIALGSSIERRIPGDVCIESFLDGDFSVGARRGLYFPALRRLRRLDSDVVADTVGQYRALDRTGLTLIKWLTGWRTSRPMA